MEDETTVLGTQKGFLFLPRKKLDEKRQQIEKRLAEMDESEDREKYEKYFCGDKIYYKNRPSNVYIIVQIQGNDYYTCRKLEIVFSACKTRYIETTVVELLFAEDMKLIPSLRNLKHKRR